MGASSASVACSSHAARLGSLTQAAQHLGLSQPAVSLHVRELEHELQAVLFDRGSFGISLTEAGERLYALAEPLLEGMEGVFAHFAERIEEDMTGRVEIAASVAGAALVLPPYIKRLRDRYPDRVGILTQDGGTDRLSDGRQGGRFEKVEKSSLCQ